MTIEKLALELNLFCIAILVLILYRVLRRDDRQESQLKFRNMLVWHIVALGINAFAPYILSLVSQDVITPTRYLLSVAYYVSLNLAVRSWFVYLGASMSLPDRLGRPYGRLVNVSTAIMVILNATSQFTHLFYYVQDGQVVIAWGQTAQAVYLFAVQLVCVIAIITYSVGHMTMPQRKRTFLICTYPVMPLVFMVFRAVVGSLPYLAVSNTMALLMIYIGYLDQLISLDPLTGVNNRDQMMESVARRMQSAHSPNLCVIMLDVDHFKSINDKFGHTVGDEALKTVARALCRTLGVPARRGAVLSRYGGDEFMIMMDLDPVEADEFIASIDRTIDACSKEAGLACPLAASAGIAWCSDDVKSPKELISKADAELYRNKYVHKG